MSILNEYYRLELKVKNVTSLTLEYSNSNPKNSIFNGFNLKLGEEIVPW